jgi:hypothetical protein
METEISLSSRRAEDPMSSGHCGVSKCKEIKITTCLM